MFLVQNNSDLKERETNMSDYNSSANIYVTNNTGGTATIYLSHKYSTDEPTEQKTWENVPNGRNTPTPLVASYNTGFVHAGVDYWWIGVNVKDGTNAGKYYESQGSADNPGKQCYLQSDDNGKNLYFTVTTNTFVMTESGPCSTDMYPGKLTHVDEE